MHFPILTESDRTLPIYVTGIGVQHRQELVNRPKGFNTYQWLVCTSGKGIITIGNLSITIDKGNGFYFAPHFPHAYEAIEEPWVTNWITFNGSAMEILIKHLKLGVFGILNYTRDLDETIQVFYQIEEIIGSDNHNRIIDTSPILYHLLFKLKDHYVEEYALPTDKSILRLIPVIQYMQDNMHKDISLESLSQQIDVTSFHLCRLFKSAFQMTPIQYLIQVRLQKAKSSLLKNPELKIQDIAKEVGYSDVSYFCKIFKKQEKVSPKAFRDLHI